MSKYLSVILISFFIQQDIPWKKAEEEFKNKNYAYASVLFQKYANENHEYAAYLYYHAGLSELLRDSIKKAQIFFSWSTHTTDKLLKSKSLNCLGILSARSDKQEEALEYWRTALKENPDNSLARYNYELLLRKKTKSPNSPNNDNNPSRSNASTKKQKNNPKHDDKGNSNNETPLSLNEVESIIDAMENEEKKFIQQLRKRNKGSKLYDGSDW